MNNAKERRHFTDQEKVAILRRHLVEKVPVSDLCEEHWLLPTVFYSWPKEWFEHGAVVFDTPKNRTRNGRSEDAAAKRIPVDTPHPAAPMLGRVFYAEFPIHLVRP